MINKYTFKKQRKCLFCDTPIADQTHAIRKFCARIVLEDGSVKSCKDDYHIPRRKENEKHYKRIFELHKMQHKSIKKLYEEKGEIVTMDDIEQYNIYLNLRVEQAKEYGKNYYFFVEYLLIEINENQYKIAKHDRIY